MLRQPRSAAIDLVSVNDMAGASIQQDGQSDRDPRRWGTSNPEARVRRGESSLHEQSNAEPRPGGESLNAARSREGSRSRDFGHLEGRPPVTIGARPEEDPAADKLEAGSERQPHLTPSARCRPGLGSVVVMVFIAAVAAGLNVQERRVAAADARALDGLSQIRAVGPYRFRRESDLPPAESAVTQLSLCLRNDGPRDVTLTHATTGGFALLTPVELPAQRLRLVAVYQQAGGAADTLLHSSASPMNGPTTYPQDWRGRLQVTATTPRGSRTITLARPPYHGGHTASPCDRLRSRAPSSSKS